MRLYTILEKIIQQSKSPSSADYIIEQGTKDGWEYEKRKSGKLEAYMHIETTTDGGGGAQSGLYLFTVNVKLPITGSTESIYLIANAQSGGAPTIMAGWRVIDNYGNAKLSFLTSNGDNRPISVNIFVRGKWK